MCFKGKKKEREWVYVLDGCHVRVVISPKAQRQARRFARNDNIGGKGALWKSKPLTPAKSVILPLS